MSELEQLTNIILVILGNDNKARKEHEDLLKGLRGKDIDSYVIVFLNLLNESTRSDVRMFCAVHLRSILSYFAESFQTSWPNLKGTTHKLIKDNLFGILNKETEKVVRKALCDLIGEIGATMTLFEDEPEKVDPEGLKWDELLPNVMQYLQSTDPIFIIAGLKIMGVLFSYSVRNYSSHNEELKSIFTNFISSSDVNIKASAIGSFACLIENSERSECDIFADLIPTVLINSVTIVLENEDLGNDVISYLMQIVEAEPKLFKPYYTDMIEGMKKIVEKKMDFDGPKETAIEIVIIFLERLPKIGRKNQESLKEVFKLIFIYMVMSVSDPDEDWASPREGFVESAEKGEIDEASIKFSMHMIDRIIAAMDEDSTIGLISSVIIDLVSNDDWRCRHAALMALSQVGEYVEDMNQMGEIVVFILNYIHDQHPKVRYAVLHAIGQIADDMHPDFQEKFHDTVFPMLLKSLNDKVPRVVAHAFAALTNFIEGCKRIHLQNRIKELLEPCLVYVQNGISLIRENAISTISALAEISNVEFIPYWQDTAQIIFTILREAVQPEYKQLRGQSIECLTLIGSAVGKDEFKKAAAEIIKIMLQIQTNHIEESDPQRSYLLSGWQRICIVLQDEFVPFMDEILPSLFDLVEKVILQDRQRRDNRDKQDADKVAQAFDKPKKKFVANTSESDDLQISLNMINVFITYLKTGYIKYVDRTTAIMIPMLNYSMSEDIRTTAAKALPGIVSIIKISGIANANELAKKASLSFIEAVWKTMNTEYEAKIMSMFVYAIREIIIAAGDKAFEQTEIETLGQLFFKALNEANERKIEKEKLFEGDEDDLDEDEDGYDPDEDPEIEEEFMLAIAAAIGALFITHKELAFNLFLHIFKEILPGALAEDKNERSHLFGIHLVDDIIENLGVDLIYEQLGDLIQALIKFTQSKACQVRKSAAIGIGAFSEHSTSDAFKKYAGDCIKALFELYKIPKTEEDEDRPYSDARDQATIALGKMVKHKSADLTDVINDVIKLWLVNLPIRSDKNEAKAQHEMLLDIITSANASLVFGGKAENMPHVLKVFAMIVDTKFSTDDIKKKMKGILRVLSSNETSKKVLELSTNVLPKELQPKIQALVNST